MDSLSSPAHGAPRASRAARRVRAALLAVLAIGAGATCRDRSLTGPGFPTEATLAVAPVFQTQPAPGGPRLRLARLRARILAHPGGRDTITRVVDFVGDSAVVQVDVSFHGTSQLYDVHLEGIDAAGDTLFRGADTVRAYPDIDVRPSALRLQYAGADAGVTAISIAPRDTTIDAPDSLRLRVAPTGASPARMYVGWTSRDTAALRISDSGTVRPRSMERAVWVVAQLFTGVRDSTLVHVRAPVASVTVTPDSTSVVRGDTTRLVAEARDSAGTVLPGRTVVWTALDSTLAVDGTGLVRGLTARTTGRVVATVGSRSDTARVRVLPVPVGSVVASPDSIQVTVGASTQLSASVLDAQGQPNADWTAAWASSDTAIAVVTSTGVLTGRAAGRTVVRATADSHADSIFVNVVAAGPTVTNVDVTPAADTAESIGDTLRFSAQAFEGTTPIAGTFTWASRDAAVATVDTAGRVVAVGNGTTYIVATETGGVRDSALVLVRQRVSTVSVTPNTVSRYLGNTQQFSANAVDARGNPVPFARFAWSSTAPSIVSIDTAGLASMVGIGSAFVRATADGITGQADVTVRTAITRIVVSPDSVTMNAFGVQQGYTAVAYDTANAPMSGLTFAWASSNPSVASLSGTTATATTATALANGTTRIRAVAQGVTGEALLTVRQTLASVEVSPASASVAPGGRVVFTARGRDPGGSYLTTNPTFSWTSSNPTVATVDGSGVVTAAVGQQGSSTISASVGSIGGSATVTVSNSGVPPVISFGRDTIKIGRGTTNQVPLYLSSPSQSPIIVSLAAADTFAYFTQAQDTFPAGTTTINVALAGRNAGSTRISASEITGNGYAAASAVATVQANVRFSTTSLSMVATDQRTASVVLSDPAPAGGVYVAFSYGTAGIAEVSPDPVFIQAGLLSAGITVRGLAPGSTTIGLSAAGVTGANTLTANVSAATLRWYYGPMRIGAGQYQPNDNYIYIPQALTYPLTVSFSSTDTTIARLEPSVTIPAGNTGIYVTSRAFENRTGTVTVTGSAPGWTSASTTITSTTPRVGICCNQSLNTTSNPVALTVYARDSLNSTHHRINSLRVSLVSRDTNVAVVDSAATIAAGATQQGGIVLRARGGGSTYVVASAGAHTSDSVLVTVAAPNLAIYYGQTRLGAGQYEPNANYVYIPNAIATPVTVTFTSTDDSVARAIGPVIIPAGQTGTYFRIEGYRPGSVTYTAHASGYNPASQTTVVTSPRAGVCCNGTFPMFQPPTAITGYARDSLNGTHPLLAATRLTFTSSDTNVVALDADTVTIAAGASSNSARRVNARNPGSARVVATGPTGWLPDTVAYVVDSANLAIYYGVGPVAAGHIAVNGNYIYVPNARSDTIRIAVNNRNPRIAAFADTIKIPPSTNGVYFSWEGVAPGMDTVTFSSPGYRSVTRVFPVSRRLLRGTDLPGNLQSTTPPFTLRAWTVDTVGNQRPVRDTVVIRMISSDTTVLRLDSAYVRIVRGQSQSTPNTARILRPTSGDTTVYVIYQDSAGLMPPDTTSRRSVPGPALRIYYGGPARVGMRQVATNVNYVYTDNNVSSPLTITLTSSNETVLRSTTATIPAGSNGTYFSITGGDTLGLVRLTATATGYQPANLDVEVGQPQLGISTNTSPTTTSPNGQIVVYLRDQANMERATTDTFTVTLVSTQPGVASPDSTTVRFLPGMSRVATPRMRYHATGTTQLIASDPRSAIHAYRPDTVGITVSTPAIRIYYGATSLGPGQYTDNYVYIPNAMSDTLRLVVRHDGSKTSLPDTVKIPPGQNGVYYRATGVSSTSGTDTITFSATGHSPGTTYLHVGPGRTSLSGWPGQLAVGDSVRLMLHTLDPAGSSKALGAAQTFTLSPSSNLVFTDGQGNTITSVTVPTNGSGVGNFWVKALSSGTGSVTVSRTGYQPSVYNTAVP